MRYALAYASSAKLAACDSGNPYSANDVIDGMIASAWSPVDALRGHALAQLQLDLPHPLLGSLESHRAPQFLGLPAGEAGGRHRHAQQLLLEQRHAERALQNRFERGMRVLDRLAPGAPIEIRMHHLPDDRARAG